MNRGSGLTRSAGLQPMSARRRAALAEAGVSPFTTFQPTAPRPARRARDTGPKRSVRDLVAIRSQGWCEWPACPNIQDHVHHRLGRKAGGRRGAASVRLNGAGWLLAACWRCHARVTDAHGDALNEAKRMGWVLTENQDALLIPAWTRHSDTPVLLDNLGDWSTT